MIIAIYSDVHGNLPAFEKFISSTKHIVDKYICLGDLVNYGPWGNECVELALSLEHCIILKGNHENYFLAKRCEVKSKLVRLFFEQCIEKFTFFEQIKNLPSEYFLNDFHYKHTIYGKYIYPNTKIRLNENYVIGHSHCQFEFTNNNHRLLNSGSIGQNRKFINIINFILYYPDLGKFEFKSIEYNSDLIINKLKSDRFPFECINYYQKKQKL